VEVSLFVKDSRDLDQAGWQQWLALPFQTLYSWRAQGDFAALLAEVQPDVVHVHNLFPLISPSILSVARKRHLPVVMTVHNFRLLCPNGLFFTQGRLCERCLNGKYYQALLYRCREDWKEAALYAFRTFLHNQLGLFIRLVDAFVVPSRFLADKLKEGGLPPEKIVYLPHFLDCSGFTSVQCPHSSYIVYFGRLSAEKGLWTLVQAMQRLAGVVLKVLGDGPLRPALEAFVQDQGIRNVELLGFQTGETLRKIIQEAAFAVLPSEWYENCPYAALEALAYGKPLVASRLGGLAELVADGVDGLLFQPGDPEDLREKIRFLRDHPTLVIEMGRKGRQKVETNHSPQLYGEKLLGLYRALPK